MSVFRGNMILLKRSAGIGLMYLCIFILITVVVQVAGQNQEETLSFDVVSSRVGIVDLDQSRISKGLAEYLRENNQVIAYENNKEALIEAIYYEDVYAVVVIPKGFSEDCLEGKGTVDITKAPNSTSVLYVDMDINKYIFQIQALKAASFTDEEVIDYAVSNAKVESGVELVESGKERITTAPYNFYFRYSPYVYLSVLIYMLGNILIPKNQKDMSQRLTCSSITETRQSLETLLAFGVSGIFIFLIIILFATGFYGVDIYKDALIGYYIANNFIFMLVSLCISFMIASVAKGQQSLNGLANVTSLGLCFLGGVFVPVQFLGEGIVKVAKFLPTYWYEINVDMLGEYIILNQEQKIKYMNGIYVQIAVAAMFVTIALLINSKKDSHVN